MTYKTDWSGTPSAPVRAFIAEIEEVCARHGFAISTSGYDGLDVFRRSKDDTTGLHCAGIEDCTLL